VETKVVSRQDWQQANRLGTIGRGLDLGRLACSQHSFITSNNPIYTQPWLMSHPHPMHNNTGRRMLPLGKFTLDVLLVDVPMDLKGTGFWHLLCNDTNASCRPKLVIESWPSGWVTHKDGPLGKSQETLWLQQGYNTDGRLLKASDFNAAHCQTRLLVRRFTGALTDWQPPSQLHSRAMQNTLRPTGIPRKAYKLGYHTSAEIPHALTSPMPAGVGSLIYTNQGVRQSLADEHARALGTPTSWIPWSKAGSGTIILPNGFAECVRNTTALALWEAALWHTTPPSDCTLPPSMPPPVHNVPLALTTWTWAPPCLQVNSPWYFEQIAALRSALALTNLYSSVTYANGMNDLTAHRSNYNAYGATPTTLRVLWWQFPPEHWHDLREGSSMNFLQAPPNITPIPRPWTEEEQQVRVAFINELIGLGVLKLALPGTIRAVAPMFDVEKAGQPGQRRVIADFKKGGQNSVMSKDPVFLPQASQILPRLYHGGYSAVVDASKFFYQFKTRADEQIYMGLQHPITNNMYQYTGLPMGSANSPAIAGRMGNAFVRSLRDAYPHLFASSHATHGWSSLSQYKAEQGFGLLELSPLL
jgi:hypothetical protein